MNSSKSYRVLKRFNTIPKKFLREYLIVYAVLLSLVLTITKEAEAIIIRDDRDDADYIVKDADYPALVDLIEKGDCIGTLVHESFLLTVAHCAADMDEGDPLVINKTPNSVSEIILHPKWKKRRDEYDIALLRLKKPVENASPLPIYRGSGEIGTSITLVGRGVTANGLKGERGAKNDGKLRKCTNIVTKVDDHFIEILFERPGENGITKIEGVGAAGDSGCPAFVRIDGVLYIAGLNSWGDGPKGIKVGQYGAYDYQTRVSRYLEWLDSVVKFPDPPSKKTGPVPSIRATHLPSGSMDQLLLSFSAESGKSYKIEKSSNLLSWEALESGIAGKDSRIEKSYPARGIRVFLRIVEE